MAKHMQKRDFAQYFSSASGNTQLRAPNLPHRPRVKFLKDLFHDVSQPITTYPGYETIGCSNITDLMRFQILTYFNAEFDTSQGATVTEQNRLWDMLPMKPDVALNVLQIGKDDFIYWMLGRPYIQSFYAYPLAVCLMADMNPDCKSSFEARYWYWMSQQLQMANCKDPFIRNNMFYQPM